MSACLNACGRPSGQSFSIVWMSSDLSAIGTGAGTGDSTVTDEQISDTPLRAGLVLQKHDSAIDLLCKEGFSSTQGVRPLRRAIEKLLSVSLSLRKQVANIPEHGKVHVCTVEGQLEIDIREPAKVEVGENVEADGLVGNMFMPSNCWLV